VGILNNDFDLTGLDRQRHPAFVAHFKAKGDHFVDIAQSFLASFALADSTLNRRTFGDPYSVFVAV
jgi:hypothetical protein